MENISFEEFSKLDIRIGTVLSVEKVPETDRLLKFEFDFGTEKRTIIGGWAISYPEPEVLIGKQMPVLCNLEPRIIKGVESQGMVLSAVLQEQPIALFPEKAVGNGAVVR
ncbi:methionine--tRNA ligase [Candidatus Berkelbacteria bacterium]|nr:methionine--tRNA ligase [Candidatus Berkelbacteria bacterium]